MYGTSSGVGHYLGTQVQSSTPMERVVLLYNAAIRHTTAARDAMDRRDLPARRAAISKVMGIVGELQQVLDMDQGGDLAKKLDGLYEWMNSQLLEAITRQNAKPLENVLRILETLADAWRTVASSAEANTAS